MDTEFTAGIHVLQQILKRAPRGVMIIIQTHINKKKSVGQIYKYIP